VPAGDDPAGTFVKTCLAQMYFSCCFVLCDYERGLLQFHYNFWPGKNPAGFLVRVNSMTQILVIANDSLLADVIESVLAQDFGLDMLRLTHYKADTVEQAIRQHRSLVMIVEEGISDQVFFAKSGLFRDSDRVLMITFSPEKQNFQICMSYQIPNPGMAQMVNLVKAFSRT
jgi:hypothetical protein